MRQWFRAWVYIQLSIEQFQRLRGYETDWGNIPRTEDTISGPNMLATACWLVLGAVGMKSPTGGTGLRTCAVKER